MAQRAWDPKRVTFEAAAELDAHENAGELEYGEWKPVTRGTWRHGKIVGNVYFALRLYAREHPGWSIATADPGTKLAHHPDLLRGPDVGVIRAEREPTGKGTAGWLDGAPDLAVEVVGDAQSVSDLAAKATEYLGAGARMVWVLDPEPRRVVTFLAPDHVRVLGPDDVLEGGDLLPGFRCVVAELFE
jgi:Uma2 family endonuclease